jgi:hypothetical protein
MSYSRRQRIFFAVGSLQNQSSRSRLILERDSCGDTLSTNCPLFAGLGPSLSAEETKKPADKGGLFRRYRMNDYRLLYWKRRRAPG